MKLQRLFPYALFLILVCIFLWRPIFKGEALLPGDYLAQMSPWNSVVKAPNPAPQWNPLQFDAIAQFYPWRVFYARSMRAGHIPFWNPHQFSGTPFLANGQSAVLYPLNLLFVIFDPITAFTVFAALHLFLAQVFMYWLMRELGCKEFGGIIAAICFAFSAFMVLWLELPTFISVAVWLPLVLLLIHRSVERKSIYHAGLGGVALAMAFLAGHLQIAFYVAFASALWWLWKTVGSLRREGRAHVFRYVLIPCAVFLAIAALISSAQVLPSMELAAKSPRYTAPSVDGYQWFIGNALKPYRLITAFAPDFFGNPSKNTYYLLGMLDGHAGSAADYMEYGMYVGILPLMLCIIGLFEIRKRRHIGFFAALGILALLVATGTPINLLFYYFVPGFSAFGGPNRILILYVFSIAVLAGFGVEHILEIATKLSPFCYRGSKRKAPWGYVQIFVAFIVLVFHAGFLSMCITFMNEPFTDPMKVQILTTGNDSWGIAMCWGAIGIVLIALYSARVLRLSMFACLLTAIIVADLFSFGINYNPTCSRDKIYPRTALTDTLKRIASNSRIAVINPSWSLFDTPTAILPPNAAMVYGLYDLQGYDSLYLKSYKDKMAQIQQADPSPPENGNMVLIRRYTPEVGKAAAYIVTSEMFSDKSLSLVAQVDGVNIYKSANSGGNRR